MPHEEPIEYETAADRLDVLENRLRLTKKTLHEVIAFANGLETRIAELEALGKGVEHKTFSRVKPEIR